MADDPRPAYLSERWQGPGIPRLLLVDDDPVMRRSSIRFLSRAGFEVVAVGTGVAALALIDAQEHFDAAVLDLEMPGMDGVRLMRELRSRRPRLPLGLWSASHRLEELTSDELSVATFVKHKMQPIGELVQAICQAIYGARAVGTAGGAEGFGASGNGSGEGDPDDDGGQSQARAALVSSFSHGISGCEDASMR